MHWSDIFSKAYSLEAVLAAFHVQETRLADRLMISRSWKSAIALNIYDVERTVDYNYAFERILALNGMKHETFANSWSIWISRRNASSGLSSL